MAISVDIKPNINSAAFAETVKLGIVRGLLTTAEDMLKRSTAPWVHTHVVSAIRALDELETRDDE